MIIIDPANTKQAMRLNGSMINGYAGYYGKAATFDGMFFIIAIPLDPEGVDDLMREIDSKE